MYERPIKAIDNQFFLITHLFQYEESFSCMLLVITMLSLTVTLMSAREKLQNYQGNVKLQIKLRFPQDERRQVENKKLKTMPSVSGKQLTLHYLN